MPFLPEQIRLLATTAKGRRYSVDMLIYAFNVYHKTPTCYEEVRKVLCLHSKHLIRDISSIIRVDSGNVCKHIFKVKLPYYSQANLK